MTSALDATLDELAPERGGFGSLDGIFFLPSSVCEDALTHSYFQCILI